MFIRKSEYYELIATCTAWAAKYQSLLSEWNTLVGQWNELTEREANRLPPSEELVRLRAHNKKLIERITRYESIN